MGFRKRAFKNPDYLSKKEVISLQEEHKKSFGCNINDLGYPDMGNGRYSALLPYHEWVQFNNLQRCHYNMVESSAPVLAMVIVAGLFYPVYCSVLGNAYALGMLLYSYGYNSNSGANGRMLGAIIRTLSTLALVGLCLYRAIIESGLKLN